MEQDADLCSEITITNKQLELAISRINSACDILVSLAANSTRYTAGKETAVNIKPCTIYLIATWLKDTVRFLEQI